MYILEVKNVSKIYTTRFGSTKVQALSNMNFSVEQGEYVAIMGESGSGKTTLLNILASLDRPTGGEVLLNGKNLAGIKEKEISAFRRDNLGFVFQDFNLLDNFSLKDNILLPLVLQGKSVEEMEQRLAPIAERLGIAQLLAKYPYEVSGGQMQRTAVARAIITNPQMILADEPTGALDSKASSGLLGVFREINRLSVLGSLAGLAMGKGLHSFVMAQVKIDSMTFACRIAPLSYLISFAMTLLFTVVISTGMRPRLRKIDMAESLKSIE